MTVPHSAVSGWIKEAKQEVLKGEVKKVDMKRAVATSSMG